MKKIIDENGKLFGKLNVIDCVALLLLAAIVVFLAVRTTGGSDANPTAQSTKLTYTVQVGAISDAVYQEVLRQMEMAGGKDQLMANGEMVNAYITKVEAAPHVSFQSTDDGRLVSCIEEGPDARLDLVFTVEAYVDNTVINKVGTQEVRVGKSHIVKTVHFEFTYGNILTCQWG